MEERCAVVAVFKPVRSRALASDRSSLKQCKPKVGLLEGFVEIRLLVGERPDAFSSQ